MNRRLSAASFAIPLTLVAAIHLANCGVSDNEVLIVTQFEDGYQPGLDELGAYVSIQSRGGTALAIRTRGGTHALGGGDPVATSSCVPITDETVLTITRLTAFPEDKELSLEIQLVDLPEGASSSASSTSTSTSSTSSGVGGGEPDEAADATPKLSPCGEEAMVLKTELVAISTEPKGSTAAAGGADSTTAATASASSASSSGTGAETTASSSGSGDGGGSGEGGASSTGGAGGDAGPTTGAAGGDGSDVGGGS